MGKRCFLLVLSIFCLTTLSDAQNADPIPATIKEYSNALKSKDRQSIEAAWNKLDQHKEDVAYLKKNLPRLYRSYRLKSIANRLEQMQVTYFDNIEPPEATPSTAKLTGSQSNQRITAASPNQAAISNDRISRSLANQRTVSNNVTARSAPNSSRNLTSTQDSIRNRK